MSSIQFEKDGAVGIVTLAKPPHNLIDHAMLEELAVRLRTGGARGLPQHPAAQRDAALLRRRRPRRPSRRSAGANRRSRRCGSARRRAGAHRRGRAWRGPGRRLRAGADVRHDHRGRHRLVRHGRGLARPAAAARRRAARGAARRPGARQGDGHVRPPPRSARARTLGRRQPRGRRSPSCRTCRCRGRASSRPGATVALRGIKTLANLSARAAASRPPMRGRKRSTPRCGAATTRRAASPRSRPPGPARPSSRGTDMTAPLRRPARRRLHARAVGPELHQDAARPRRRRHQDRAAGRRCRARRRAAHRPDVDLLRAAERRQAQHQPRPELARGARDRRARCAATPT